MGLDICLLSHFNLMDYSLLFVIEYNPMYVSMFPHLFKQDKQGNVIYPIEPTEEEKQKM